MSIDFSNYTLDELLQSLEGVDDIAYPENAMTIYKLILGKLNLDHSEIDAKALGYESSEFSEMVFMGLIGFPFESLVKDQHLQNVEMKEKIERLNKRIIEEQES